MRNLIFLISIWCSINVASQNLVLNPSFESINMQLCSTLCVNPNPCIPLFDIVDNWDYLSYYQSYQTSEYFFSSCYTNNPIDFSFLTPPVTLYANYLQPHSGENHVCELLYFYQFHADTSTNELVYEDSLTCGYIQGRFSEPLITGTKYKFSIYASLSDYVWTTANALGLITSDTLISSQNYQVQIQPIALFSQFITAKQEYEKLECEFIATGPSMYFAIGNFLKPGNFDTLFVGLGNVQYQMMNEYRASNIFLDDIAIYPADAPIYPADAGGDQILCKGESLILGSPSRSQYLYWWYDEHGNLIDTTGQIIVTPDSSTYYILYQKDFKFDESYDTAFVYVTDCADPLYIPNIFSPNGDGNNDIFWIRGEGIAEIKNFIVYDRWGEEVHNCKCNEIGHGSNCCGWDGTYKGEEAPVGVYAYYVEAVLVNGETVIKRGNVTLVR